MPSGIVFYKLTVFICSQKKDFLMSNLAKKFRSFNLFLLAECSPTDKYMYMKLSIFIHIFQFEILYSIMKLADTRRNSNNSYLHNLSLST